jgi:hypothetical protein
MLFSIVSLVEESKLKRPIAIPINVNNIPSVGNKCGIKSNR